jgi:hypothetical protein
MAKTKLEVKRYDLWWCDKQKHIKEELLRVVKENGLEDQLVEFSKTELEYQELAESKLGLINDTIKKTMPKAKSKVVKASTPVSIGLDFED